MVVTRESEWDETTRGRALALAEVELDLCTCGCGLPMAIAHDPKRRFKVDKWTCYAEKNRDRVKRKHLDEHRDGEGKLPEGFEDGMHWYVTEATEADIVKDQERRAQSKQKKVERARMSRKAGRV